MLSDEDYHVFLDRTLDAWDCVRLGDVAEGYQYLLTALREAEQAHEAGKPGTGGLVCRYRDTLDRYATQFRIRQR
jgi:hypothetical protein